MNYEFVIYQKFRKGAPQYFALFLLKTRAYNHFYL
jgi:hypothetical protein